MLNLNVAIYIVFLITTCMHTNSPTIFYGSPADTLLRIIQVWVVFFLFAFFFATVHATSFLRVNQTFRKSTFHRCVARLKSVPSTTTIRSCGDQSCYACVCFCRHITHSHTHLIERSSRSYWTWMSSCPNTCIIRAHALTHKSAASDCICRQCKLHFCATQYSLFAHRMATLFVSIFLYFLFQRQLPVI